MKLTGYEEYKFSYRTPGTHGNRWATEEEMADSLYHMRLSDPDGAFRGGMPVMGDGDELYVDASDTHSLIIGSTGSKKTRLFAMPMLETFRIRGCRIPGLCDQSPGSLPQPLLESPVHGPGLLPAGRR